MSNNTPNTSGTFNLFGGGQTASPTAQPTGNLFGQAAQSSTSGTSSPFGGGQSNLFGSSNTQSGGFGGLGQGNTGNQSNQGSSGSNLFGATSGSSTPFSFNKPADKQQEGGNSSNLFSTPNKTSTSQGQTGNLFGNLGSNQASSAPSGSATPTTTKPAFSFLSTTPAGPPPSTNLFGSLGSQENKGGSVFGASQTASKPSDQSAQSSGSSLFGNQQQTSSSQQNASSVFAPTAAKPMLNLQSPSNTANSTAATISQEAPKQTPFSFPSTGSQQNTASGDSNSGKSENQVSSAAPLSFGNAANATAASADQGNAGSNSSAKPNMFAAPGSTSTPKSGFFANLNQGQEQKKDDQTSSTTQSGGLFGATAPKNDEQKGNATPSTGLFGGINQKKDTDSTATSQQPSSTTISTSTPNTLAPTSTTAFGGQSKAEQTQSTSQAPTSSSAAAPTTTSATLGSSTSGPAPSAQSRLKNKSMDEIITRWASDLAKYQKEFQAQAEKVAEWDRMLLENGNALAGLYSRTFQAERDSAEVEKQISAVEGQQDELSSWLDRYEREVDEMMARQVGQGEGLQGPDQERERTYKTAERVSERLDEMGKELTSMIEEINDASTAVSKTSKPDDPLSSIVRILNGHLSQLQLIDQGTAALQGKVAAAQQQSQRMGSRLHGGYNDAADSFSRSYLGK